MKVKKRDNSIEVFQIERVQNAIAQAFHACERRYDESVLKCVMKKFKRVKEDDVIDLEDIQDTIEECLMMYSPEIAKHFIIYRHEHAVLRDKYDKLTKKVEKKLLALEIENQNANVDEYSFGGRMGEAMRVVTKDYALNHCMSKKSKKNNENNEIYIHDLDSYSVGEHNCESLPFDQLLNDGFNTRQTDVRPANSINTAMQLVAVLFQLQSLQQFGGVSATHLDWTMVPFVRKSFYKHYRDGLEYILGKDIETLGVEPTASIDSDTYKKEKKVYKYALNLTERELKQAVEGLYHNLNTLQSRSGNQLPFTSINYGTCTLPEGRIVIKALLMGSINGVGKYHKTPIFPCGIFQCKEGVNRHEGDPNYDLFRLALKSTAQRIYPNYANCDAPMQKEWVAYDREIKNRVINELSDEDREKLISRLKENPTLCDKLFLTPTDNGLEIQKEEKPFEIFSTMGCRTVNGADINAEISYRNNIRSVIDSGKIIDTILSAAQKDGRGNICPVTIILPTLAMEADRDVAKFLKLLDKKIYEAKDMLIERFDWIAKQNPLSAKFMWENNTMSGYIPKEGTRSGLRHGTIVIGQLGMAETLQLLLGQDHTTKVGMDLAKEIENIFKTRCAEFKKEYNLNFGVYYTPAENLCHTALKKFRAKYGVIEKVSDKDFFTNSMHVPVWHELTPFEKIDIEAQLVGYSSAGCITYVELDSGVKYNIDAMEEIVSYAMDKGIPYFAINVPIDDCNDCGYSDEMGDVCPQCGSRNISRLRRVTGYLSGDYTSAFNYGKQKEVEHRVKHIREIVV